MIKSANNAEILLSLQHTKCSLSHAIYQLDTHHDYIVKVKINTMYLIITYRETYASLIDHTFITTHTMYYQYINFAVWLWKRGVYITKIIWHYMEIFYK